jgi:hypothetical protein
MPEATVDEVAHHGERRAELTLESSTMALYVSVVLLAALVALEDGATHDDGEMLGLIWGTTLGLALAHYFAFRVASRLVRGTTFHKRDGEIALAQLGGAALVAALCSIPVLLFPDSSKNDFVRLELAFLLGIAGYAAGRTGGTTRLRSLATGLIVLALGVGVALAKNALLGH